MPWYVAAGWALDLFRGGRVREHEDLEIAVPNDRFADVRAALADFEVFVPVGDGQVRRFESLDDGELAETHQSWFRERPTGLWRLDVFREPSQGQTWVCRRDERIRRPFAEVITRTPGSIPYAVPEVVLLYKAKHDRPKDEADFAAVAPLLGPGQKRWLAEALTLIHPGHRWLSDLSP